MFTVTFEADFKNLQGKIVKANKRTFENQRESVRELGRRWVEIIREEAPSGNSPVKDPRRTRGVTLRESALYRTFVENGTIGFRGYTEQPISKYVVEGTRRHDIPLNHYSKTLAFFWKKVGRFTVVPKSGAIGNVKPGTLVISKGFVDHPGTKPNPFTTRAATRLATEYPAALNRVAEQWVMTFGES
jgi:hypothetical protein